MKSFNSKTWGEVHIQELKYVNNNRLALQLVQIGWGNLYNLYVDKPKAVIAPLGMLTVNLSEEELSDGEFFVKTWGENEEISVEALASRLFIDTGRRVKTGWVKAQVWRFNPEEEEQNENIT